VNFLEARRLVDEFKGGPPLAFLFALSGSAEPFDLYLRAAGAKRGLSIAASVLPFNTLGQTLRRELGTPAIEVILLAPWDFAPEADWRSTSVDRADEAKLRESASEVEQLLARRPARLLYIPAPIPPLFADPQRNAAFALTLESLAVGLGATVLPPQTFSMSGYLASGCPIGGAWIGQVADAIVEVASKPVVSPKKVLVTDLDNVLWSGGVGEDSLEGIAFDQDGRGYPHFLYQSFLRQLQRGGTLLAAVSRNDAEIALSPFRAGAMPLREENFVAIIASYHAKSAQISELASELNLALDAFVFVDDNPIELAEVASALPAVRCIPFPPADGLPGLFAELTRLFGHRDVTAEDRERTALYRRRLAGIAPSDLNGADLTGFLRGLCMTLTIHDRSQGDLTRAVQLINKTNQFNLNGRRVSEQEVTAVLDAGGRLYGATLTDRTGSHGEVLACLVSVERVVLSFVMSCRVFQRRAEHAFLGWLVGEPDPPSAMSWVSTPRNEPFAHFLREVTGEAFPAEGMVAFSPTDVGLRFAHNQALFNLQVLGPRAA
jgi:FkbH-like protein